MSQPDLTEELEDSVKWATATLYQGMTSSVHWLSQMSSSRLQVVQIR